MPKRWIVVNDGSTDQTGEIVLKYTKSFPWIELLQMPEHRDYTFSAKARCFNAGFERLRKLDFDIIANIDADISFDEDYFEFLLKQFAQFSDLGVAGTPMREGN